MAATFYVNGKKKVVRIVRRYDYERFEGTYKGFDIAIRVDESEEAEGVETAFFAFVTNNKPFGVIVDGVYEYPSIEGAIKMCLTNILSE
jgi:hypothetical protein